MKKIKNILGLTILEGLISTAIVGIGFIAILQMVNYSVQSKIAIIKGYFSMISLNNSSKFRAYIPKTKLSHPEILN